MFSGSQRNESEREGHLFLHINAKELLGKSEK